MSTVKHPLKYLWTARYEDGSTFTQPEDDRSKDHDETSEWSPSAFRDIDHDRLTVFSINDNDNTFSVDFRSGEFRVNDTPFVQHDQNFIPSEPLRLIYFREVRQEFINGEPQDPYVNRYFIGWQAKDQNGKNHKYTLGVV